MEQQQAIVSTLSWAARSCLHAMWVFTCVHVWSGSWRILLKYNKWLSLWGMILRCQQFLVLIPFEICSYVFWKAELQGGRRRQRERETVTVHGWFTPQKPSMARAELDLCQGRGAFLGFPHMSAGTQIIGPSPAPFPRPPARSGAGSGAAETHITAHNAALQCCWHCSGSLTHCIKMPAPTLIFFL